MFGNVMISREDEQARRHRCPLRNPNHARKGIIFFLNAKSLAILMALNPKNENALNQEFK